MSPPSGSSACGFRNVIVNGCFCAGDMGLHTVPEETGAAQQVRGMDQPRYGGRGRRRSVPAVRGLVPVHDVGQEAQAGEGAQRGGKGERAVAATVQQSAATPVFPTGAVRPERPGPRRVRGPRRILSHGTCLATFH